MHDFVVELCAIVACVIDDSPFLLYAKESQIRSLELDASVNPASHAGSFQPVVTSNTVISMDVDSREGYVYWVEQQISTAANQAKVWSEF